jgi:hypothetical protein
MLKNTKYEQNKTRLLKFCYVAATSATSSKGIFGFLAAATNSTNETNKAGGMWH